MGKEKVIADKVREHVEKYGDKLMYVAIPYLDGQFLERLHVLTPKGKEFLDEMIRRDMWEKKK